MQKPLLYHGHASHAPGWFYWKLGCWESKYVKPKRKRSFREQAIMDMITDNKIIETLIKQNWVAETENLNNPPPPINSMQDIPVQDAEVEDLTNPPPSII